MSHCQSTAPPLMSMENVPHVFPVMKSTQRANVSLSSFQVLKMITALSTVTLTRKARSTPNGSRTVFKSVSNVRMDMNSKMENAWLLSDLTILSVGNGMKMVNAANAPSELFWVMMESALQFLISVRSGMRRPEPVLAAMLDTSWKRVTASLTRPDLCKEFILSIFPFLVFFIFLLIFIFLYLFFTSIFSFLIL